MTHIIRESIFSALLVVLVVFVAGAGAVFVGWLDFGAVFALALFASATSLAVGAALQHGIVLHTARARAAWLWNVHNVEAPMIIDAPRRATLPSPIAIERTRLTVVRTNSDKSAPAEFTHDTGERVRLVNVPTVKMLDDAREDELNEFIELLPVRGVAWRSWRGYTFASGRQLKAYEDFTPLVDVLVKAGLLVGRGERASGELVTRDVDAMKARLGLVAMAECSV